MKRNPESKGHKEFRFVGLKDLVDYRRTVLQTIVNLTERMTKTKTSLRKYRFATDTLLLRDY